MVANFDTGNCYKSKGMSVGNYSLVVVHAGFSYCMFSEFNVVNSTLIIGTFIGGSGNHGNHVDLDMDLFLPCNIEFN